MNRDFHTVIVAAGIATLLSACGANSDQSRYTNLVWRLISGNRMEVTREQAGGIPFASIGVAIGSADEGLMVLGVAGEGGRQEWYARTQMLAMNNGRIVQSCKLVNDELTFIDRLDPIRLTIQRGQDLVEIELVPEP